MTTLRERFEETRILNRLVAWAISIQSRVTEFGSIELGGDDQIALEFQDKQKEVLAFIKEELNRLAEEVEVNSKNQIDFRLEDKWLSKTASFNEAVKKAATLIRSKADELN